MPRYSSPLRQANLAWERFDRRPLSPPLGYWPYAFGNPLAERPAGNPARGVPLGRAAAPPICLLGTRPSGPDCCRARLIPLKSAFFAGFSTVAGDTERHKVLGRVWAAPARGMTRCAAR